MISVAEYSDHDAIGLMDLRRRGEVSSDELKACALEAIEALNPALNFLISRASEESEASSDGAQFSGLPFLLKEGVGAKGQPLDMGSRLTAGMLAEEDCELVRRLRATGVVFLGSTAAPEFGNSPTTESILHGPTRNPWNVEHSPGGSSGGASAAVAAGIVPVAQSSDGAGSIRTPAHCCGVFGLKPSRGRNPVGPKSFGGPFGFGVAHVTTRSVRDSAAFLDNLHGLEFGALYRVSEPGTSYLGALSARPKTMRIAYTVASPSGVHTSADCAAATIAAAKICAELGHAVEEAAPNYEWELLMTAMTDLWSDHWPHLASLAEKSSGRRAGPDTLEGASLAMLEHGAKLTTTQLLQSMTILHGIAAKVERFFADWDVLLSPVALTPAPRLGVINSPAFTGTARDWLDAALSRFAAFAPVFNVAGLPAASIPLGMSADGLPVGVQAAARFGDELSVLTLAAQLEEAMPWRQRRPAMHVQSAKFSAPR